MTLNTSFSLRAVVLAAGVLLSLSATAALFEDTDARRAILELRERVERQGEEIQTSSAACWSSKTSLKLCAKKRPACAVKKKS